MKNAKGHRIIMGSVLMVAILLLGVGLGSAQNILQTIQVDFYAVKKIVIDNQDKTPTDDMKPFVYNGRTYVPLRYVAEAMGKPVEWDPSTGTVYINGAPENKKIDSLFDDFSQPLSQNWNSSILQGSWSVDPANGAYGEERSYLVLNPEKYAVSQNFTMEAEVAPLKKNEGTPFCVCCDVGLLIGGNQSYGWDQPRIYLSCQSDGCVRAEGNGIISKSVETQITSNKFYKLKVIKRGKDLNVYVDDKYMLLTSLKDENANMIGIYSYFGSYIKDFKITND